MNRRGFTLLEAMLALVIFGVITAVLSSTISVAYRAQESAQSRQEEAASVRGLFGSLTRDIQSSWASINSPVSVFLTGSGTSGGTASSGSGTLLTLSALTHRIEGVDIPASGDMSGSGTQGSDAAQMPSTPQWDGSLIRYELDPTTGFLSRSQVPVPSLELLGQAQPGPQTILVRNVDSVLLRFWDSAQRTWRNDWSYQQQNQQNAPQNSQNGSGSGSTGSSSGDTSLPSMVEVTLVLRKVDGTTAAYSTTIPLIAPQPIQPVKQASTGQGSQGSTGESSGGQ